MLLPDLFLLDEMYTGLVICAFHIKFSSLFPSF
jgi:hypothetical protein